MCTVGVWDTRLDSLLSGTVTIHLQYEQPVVCWFSSLIPNRPINIKWVKTNVHEVIFRRPIPFFHRPIPFFHRPIPFFHRPHPFLSLSHPFLFQLTKINQQPRCFIQACEFTPVTATRIRHIRTRGPALLFLDKRLFISNLWLADKVSLGLFSHNPRLNLFGHVLIKLSLSWWTFLHHNFVSRN